MSGVPKEWVRTMSHLHDARIARDVMQDLSQPQTVRDEATVRYARAVDAMVDDLGMLQGAQVLGRITMFLSRKERS